MSDTEEIILAYKHLISKYRPPIYLSHVRAIIVDEAFLISAVLWTLVDVIMRNVTGKLKESFGGVPFLVIGDPLQGFVI